VQRQVAANVPYPQVTAVAGQQLERFPLALGSAAVCWPLSYTHQGHMRFISNYHQFGTYEIKQPNCTSY
jgi:hypothetical protein